MSDIKLKDNGKPEVGTSASAKKVDAKLNSATSKKLLAGIAELAPHIVKVLPIYAGADEKSRVELLAHSPVLAAFIALFDGLNIIKAE